jgi:hypothetical protein
MLKCLQSCIIEQNSGVYMLSSLREAFYLHYKQQS